MMTAVTALLARSLRMDSRSLLIHATRFGLMVAIYVALCCALAIATRFGAPGLRFFAASVYLNVIFLTLLGIGFFSTTITEEKEEDTLGLMLMAGIGPLGLLLGKLGGRLIQALLLIAVQYPFTLLAVTMGGVSMSQVQSAYIGITSYMLMLAGIGLLCSTLAPRSRTAGSWMVIVLAVYTLMPYVVREIMRRGGIPRIGTASLVGSFLRSLADSSLFVRIEAILRTGFGESPWSFQVLTNGLIGLACFIASWCLFDFGTQTVSSESMPRTGLGRKTSGMVRNFSPGRAWANPFAWKDFHFVAGGLSMRVVRLVLYAALFFVSCGLAELFRFRGWGSDLSKMVGVYLFFLCCALSWETAMMAARCIQDEIRGQTLAPLIMLPRSSVEILYSKLGGTMLGLYPGFLALCAGCLIAPINVFEFLTPRDPGPFILAHLILVPHLAAVYALWLRWGAVSLAIGSMIGLFAFCIAVFEVVFRFRESTFNLIGFFILLFCVACHFFLMAQFRRFAERG